MKKHTYLLLAFIPVLIFAHDGEMHIEKNPEVSVDKTISVKADHLKKNHLMHLKSENDQGVSMSTEAYKKANHDMHTAMMREYTGDPDIDFVRGMIPHHKGAIDMAKIVQTYGKNGNVKNFANKVIRDQTKEINSMKGHLKRLEENLSKNFKRHSKAIIEYRKADKKMHHQMNIEFSENADIDFVRGMIPHHKGAIDMARVVLEHGKDPNVRTLAWAIINAQDSEIYWMKTWLRKLKWRTVYMSS